MGKIEALCTSAKKGVPKTPIGSATFIAGAGIQGDAHAGPGKRQVSLLSADDIDGVRVKIPTIAPGAFAENVVVSGIDFSTLGIGSRLGLGKEVELKVTQIGKECHTPCEIARLTGDCIMPKLGLFAQVNHGGKVAVGDSVVILESLPRPSS